MSMKELHRISQPLQETPHPDIAEWKIVKTLLMEDLPLSFVLNTMRVAYARAGMVHGIKDDTAMTASLLRQDLYLNRGNPNKVHEEMPYPEERRHLPNP